MSCLWCLDRCVKLEPDLQNDCKETQKEPLVDLIQLIEQLAWQRLATEPPAALSLGERLCGLKKACRLEVDKTFISIGHADTINLHNPRKEVPDAEDKRAADEDSEAPPPPKDRNATDVYLAAPKDAAADARTFLFQSRFHNKTEGKQTYSFKTERQTRSAVEMSLQRGFTLGQSLELDVKIPTPMKGCKVTGKLGGQMQWSFTRGKVSRHEEQVTWSVDSHVEVLPQTTGTATLEVEELRWKSDFSLRCVIQPRPTIDFADDAQGEDSIQDDDEADVTRFSVFVRRRTSGQLVKVLKLSRWAIINARPHHFEPYDKDKSGIVCNLQGECLSVCAVSQRVWLEQGALTPSTERAGIIHQTSVTS